MTDPGDQRAAAAGVRGRLRASHADREQAIELLKVAFVQDRLTKDELDMRVGRALTARTGAELAAVTADIPAGLIRYQMPREPVRNRPPISTAAKAGICVVVVVAVTAVMAVATGGLALILCAPFYLGALLVAGAQMLASRHEKRSRGQLPPRPGKAGQAPEVQQVGRPAHDPALPPDRPDQTRADLRSDSSRPGWPYSPGRVARTPHGVRPVPDAG